MRLEPSRDIGLQNLLRKGLAIIRDEVPDTDGQEQLFDTLIEIFSEANRGSDRLGLRKLSVDEGERLDLERFSVFFRYLASNYGADLSNRLTETTEVLRTMREHGTAEEQRKIRTADLIETFLAALHRDRALRPLKAPRAVVYG